jgi:hypothetical protein
MPFAHDFTDASKPCPCGAGPHEAHIPMDDTLDDLERLSDLIRETPIHPIHLR